MAAQCFLVVTAPVSAQDRMTLSGPMTCLLALLRLRFATHRVRRHEGRELGQDGFERVLFVSIERVQRTMQELPRLDLDLPRDGGALVGHPDPPDAPIGVGLLALDEA